MLCTQDPHTFDEIPGRNCNQRILYAENVSFHFVKYDGKIREPFESNCQILFKIYGCKCANKIRVKNWVKSFI